jgi:hypothetical protein
MKKVIILGALVVLSMASCKKERTCACTVTPVSQTVNGVTQTISTTPITYEKKHTKVSKKGAHCVSGTETDTEVSNGVTTVDVMKFDCELK